MSKSKPDCCTCGACCVSVFDQDVFCDVTEKDIKRLGLSPALAQKYILSPDTVTRLLEAINGHCHNYTALATQWRMQRTGPLKGEQLCACVFLRGSVFHCVSCRVYDKRPRVCRIAVKPGDRTCREIRKMFQRCIEEAK